MRLFDALLGRLRPAPRPKSLLDAIEERRADRDFQERLQCAVERNREALDLLAK